MLTRVFRILCSTSPFVVLFYCLLVWSHRSVRSLVSAQRVSASILVMILDVERFPYFQFSTIAGFAVVWFQGSVSTVQVVSDSGRGIYFVCII